MEWWHELVGYNDEQLTAYQMIIRAIIIFFIFLLFIRIAGTRTLGNKTIFDQIIPLILGAILGRAIVTPQPIPATLGVVLVLMLLHRLVAWLTFRTHAAGYIIKGKPLPLVRNGEIQWENLKRSHITVHDIQETMRLQGHEVKIEKIKECHLERSGKISVIMTE